MLTNALGKTVRLADFDAILRSDLTLKILIGNGFFLFQKLSGCLTS